MAFYLLMNCDYCGGSSISFCQGDKCGQNHDLHKFLCDNCAKVHKFCRLCQSVIRTDAQTLNIERHREQIGFDSHVSILRKGLRECAHCGVKESDLNGLKACGACKRAFYCDNICQKKDWDRHKVSTCYRKEKICLNCKKS